MIRRSTLVFLTCMAALSVSAMRTKSAASAIMAQGAAAQVLLLAQASGESASTNPLSINDKGPAVTALQSRLEQSGYYSGKIDGLYGLDTQRAVTAFQSDEGLTPTGSIDETTWLRLQTLSSQDTSTGAQSLEANLTETVPADARPTDRSTDVLIVDSQRPTSSSPDAATTDTSTSLADNQTPTAPTASELPLAGSSDASANADADSSEGGFQRMLWLSLGLLGLLSSFGVGFYLANRNKLGSDPEEGSWGEIDDDELPPISIGEPTVSATSKPLAGNREHHGFASNGVRPGGSVGGNGAAGSPNAAITHTAVSPLHSTGQMGGTAPLAKVDIIEGLIGDLRNPDPTRRRKAIWELGQRGNSLAMQPLVDSMVTADSKEKSLVLAALSEIGIRSLKPMSRALAIALQDDNPEVRKNAIRDLTRVYDLVVQISQMLGHATEDEDPEVRQTATWALDQLNRIRQSQDLDSTVRSFAGNSATPIDLLSSEASMRRTTQS